MIDIFLILMKINLMISDLGMTCMRYPAPTLSTTQIKENNTCAGDEKPALSKAVWADITRAKF